MEKARKTIAKLFAVIVLAVAMLLCGVLVGCGSWQDTVRDTDDIDCDQPAPTGIYMKAEIEEKEYFDIDDISVSILCGIDIDFYNIQRSFSTFGILEDEIEVQGIYIFAYDCETYMDEKYDATDFNKYRYADFNKISDSLKTLEVGDANSGMFLIDEIPFTIETYVWEVFTDYYSQYQYICLDNLKGTEYECTISNNSNEILCYKKINVKLPRELFANASGTIKILKPTALGRHSDGSISNIQLYEDEIIFFDYSVEGDKVILSDIILGNTSIVDGTKEDDIESKTKSSYNAKLTKEAIVEYEKESEQKQKKNNLKHI